MAARCRRLLFQHRLHLERYDDSLEHGIRSPERRAGVLQRLEHPLSIARVLLGALRLAGDLKEGKHATAAVTVNKRPREDGALPHL
jgi:hypothetical protein